MFKQIAYEFRVRRSLRLISLGVVVVFDLLLYLLFANGGLLGNAGQVLSIVFSSLALAALSCIGLFCDFDALHRLFATPAAYHVHLAPASAFTLLGSRVLINLLQDLVFTVVGVCGLLLQLTAFVGDFSFGLVVRTLASPDILTTILMALVGYVQLILVIYFGVTLCCTAFGSMRGRKPLSILIAFALVYVIEEAGVVLLPLHNGTIMNAGPFVAFEILPLPSLAAFIYLALNLALCAAIYLVSGKLMERKLNLS